MESTVRAITEPDVPSYHRCLDVVARERRFLAFYEAPPLERSLAFVRSQLESGAPMFVAAHASEIVGWCDISPLSRASLAHRGDLGMGVHPDYRGHGIGRRLLQTTLAAARTFGLERVELAVLTNNAPAVALYRSAGFELEGTIRRAQKLDDGYADDYIMALFLQ